jgi:hypothetical protein
MRLKVKGLGAATQKRNRKAGDRGMPLQFWPGEKKKKVGG